MNVYAELMRLNSWVVDYLPNVYAETDAPQALTKIGEPGRVQRAGEILFRLPFVAWFERWEMNRKIQRLTQEQSSSFESHFSADVCKGHVDRHGESVERALAVRLADPPFPLRAERSAGVVEAGRGLG
jgi:hypothetical protein